MKKGKLFITLSFLLCLTTNAFALECSISYDTSGNKISLKGTASAPVTVLVTPKDADISALSTSNPPAAGAQYDFHTETSFDKVIRLDADLPSGLYVVKVQSNEQSMAATDANDRLYGTASNNSVVIGQEINHINADDAVSLLDSLNDAADDADALYEAIVSGTTGSSTNASLMEVDVEDFTSTYGQYACEQMVGTLDGEIFTGTSHVLSLLNEYKLLYEAIHASSAEEAITLIEDNAAYFDADIDRFVSSLDDNTAAKLIELTGDFKADGRSWSESLPELSALATAQAADRWQTLKTMITDTYADVLEIDYDDVDNIDRVFSKMMDYEYSTFDDIADGFSKADSQVNGTVYTPIISGGSGGGGGGGSSSGGSATSNFELAPNRVEQREEAARGISFSDVAADFWAYDAINTLADSQIISGYPNGTYLPAGNVTRAEFVKMLVSAFEIPEGGAISFSDVSADDWYYSYVSAAYSNAIISGVSADSFNPDGAITREDASVIVYRYLSGLGALEPGSNAGFADADEFSAYAVDAINTLSGNGIVKGVGDNRFDAKANIDRASCAVLILNCMEAIQ